MGGIPTGLAGELRSALGFSERELEANRQGRVTRRQWFGLARINIVRGIIFGLIGLASLLVTVIVAYAPVGEFGTTRERTNVAITTMLVAVASVLSASYFWWRARRVIGEAAYREIESCTGPMAATQQFVQTLNPRAHTYRFFIVAPGHTFRIPYSVFRVFEDGLEYRAYFARKSETLLSIEPLGSVEASREHRHRWGSLEIPFWLGTLPLLVALAMLGSLYLGSLPATALFAIALVLTLLIEVWIVRGPLF